jgi:hypothetical protein
MWVLPLALALAAGGCSSNDNTIDPELVVNSLDDVATPPAGTITLRSALEAAASGDTITFDSSLDGDTIVLTVIGNEHSVLKGEVYVNNVYSGYQERDYGKSALYARKNIKIDASDLPNGITVRWGGGGASHARVLAVYGDLTMWNVTIESGYAQTEAIAGGTQPYTLARGGGLAIWGTAKLYDCAVIGNTCEGEATSARDRGTYGGGIYANGLDLNDCVISGNRVTANHAYGGGIFTLSGGPTNLATMFLTNCTIARNLAEDHPDYANTGQWYDRGGGVYMGGGSLWLSACTIVENAVTGQLAYFSGKPNIGGGGVCATIGNAHSVETVWLQNSIVVGNTMNGGVEDWFAGSILDLFSQGYNLVGRINFSWILVPVPDWMMSSRKRWPKAGDHDGITLAEAVDVAGAQYHPTALSAGVDPGQPAVLWYPPTGLAVDKIPNQDYSITYVNAGYTGDGLPTDDFLNYVILQCRSQYGAILGADFGTEFGDMTGTTWYGPAVTWPSNTQNAAWITFWHDLDTAIGDRLGMVILGDDFWGTFTTGPLGDHVSITVTRSTEMFHMEGQDQLGVTRPRNSTGDIGAIER